LIEINGKVLKYRNNVLEEAHDGSKVVSWFLASRPCLPTCRR